MPNQKAHLDKAKGNEKLAKSMSLDSQSKIDWTLIMLFYSVMHYVEAYLATRNLHNRSHTTRDNAVGRDTDLKKIFNEYQDLKFYGYNARYEPPQFTAQDVDQALPQFETVKQHISALL